MSDNNKSNSQTQKPQSPKVQPSRPSENWERRSGQPDKISPPPKPRP